ncbi:hypothetical protein [Nocardia sp. NPDC060259]|uniref:hypothetical protein n=1 Tax=Nocardia sp. NPDC060259 TaxID=3347088 RepID=UPI003659DFEC
MVDIAGLGDRRYFVRFYDTPVWSVVDMAKLDFDQAGVTAVDTRANWLVDETPSA